MASGAQLRKIDKLKLSRAMDRDKMIEVAIEIGATVHYPSGRNNHFRIEHPGCEERLVLSSGRKDTPWCAIQWMRRAVKYQRQLLNRGAAAEKVRQ